MTEYTLLCERKAAFETNSSSSHSLVIDKDSPLMTQDEINRFVSRAGVIYIRDDEYGWEIETYSDPQSKMNYLYTYAHSCGRSELEQELAEAIKEFTGVSVVYDPIGGYGGYVDHQSVDVPASVFEQGKQGIIDFVFRTGSYFQTDNDNH